MNHYRVLSVFCTSLKEKNTNHFGVSKLRGFYKLTDLQAEKRDESITEQKFKTSKWNRRPFFFTFQGGMTISQRRFDIHINKCSLNR